MTYEEQHMMFSQMRLTLSARRERMIRKLAQESVDDPKTYSGGRYFPVVTNGPTIGHMIETMPAQGTSRYRMIEVTLIPELASYPEEAQLIAEYIIRDQWQDA